MKSLLKRTFSLGKPDIKVNDRTPEDGELQIAHIFKAKAAEEVPLWSVADVTTWVSKLGFSKAIVDAFRDVEVDGDLLLQLDEKNLKEDINMTNGIHRKRFLRELNNLKKSADYSSKDPSNVADFLGNSIGPDYRVFTYNLIKNDLSPSYMRRLSESDQNSLLKEVGIDSSIHRHKIIEAIEDNGADGISSSPSTNFMGGIDVYISYNRSLSAELASLIRMQLQIRGLAVSTAEGSRGKRYIRQAKSFIIILAQSLERCIGKGGSNNYLYREIAQALDAECNIIPVIDNFQFPDPEEMPEDIRALCYFNGVRWVHDYQDACVDKLERFIRGESSCSYSRAESWVMPRGACGSGRSTPNLALQLQMPAFGRLERRKTVSMESGISFSASG